MILRTPSFSRVSAPSGICSISRDSRKHLPESAISLFYRFPCGPQTEEVTVDAEAGHLTLGQRCNHRIAAEFFPGMDVGHVDFHDGNLQNRQGVPKGVAVMGPCARIDDDRIDTLPVRLMDLFAEFSFMIGLEGLDAG